MSSGALGLIELVLVLGLVLGWGVREWWSVRRGAWPEDERPKDADREPAAPRDVGDAPAADPGTDPPPR